MSQSKRNTQVLQGQKRRRRQWLTFLRMVRYGINNFSRNAWLTIAATAVMTITLMIFFATMVAQRVLHDSTAAISEKVDMSIYLKTGTTDAQAKPIMDDLMKLSNVREVSFVSSEEARANNAENNKQDTAVLEAINEADNALPATIRVFLKNIEDISQLDDFVKNDAALKKYLSTDRPPSFAGDRREAIKAIANWTVIAQQIGLVASSIFIIISSLIIFNTIRMAIFSRKEEIQMMKLIGANKSFIRGPFIVEAIMYGFIAALLATGLGVAGMLFLEPRLAPAGVVMEPTVEFVLSFIGFILLGMIAIGGIIGIISSLLATRKYLKI